jgi:hypothetical protein
VQIDATVAFAMAVAHATAANAAPGHFVGWI